MFFLPKLAAGPWSLMDEPRITRMGADFQILVALIRAIGVIDGFKPLWLKEA